MDDGLWVPIVLFIVTGFCTIGFLYFNNKNRNAIMDTVQKSMDTGSDMTPDLLAKLGAAINPKIRDMRRGIVLMTLAYAAGMSHAEIATVVDQPLGSIKARIHRAKLKLNNWLNKNDHSIQTQTTNQSANREGRHA